MTCIGSLTRVLLSSLLVLGAALACLKPPAAHAACVQWEASGDMTLHQANGYRPSFSLQRSGSELHGSATYIVTTPKCIERANCPEISGDVAGSIVGDTFEVTAYWKNGSIGVYRGGVDAHGGLEGTTFDRNHPESSSSWYSERTLRCSSSPKPPPASAPAAKPPSPPPPANGIESVPLPRGNADKLFKMKP